MVTIRTKGNNRMTKLSEIERIKLKAIYYNSLSVGLLMAGFFVPYLEFAQNLGTIIDRITLHSPWTFTQVADFAAAVLAIILAFTGARKLRQMADETIAELDKYSD